MMKSEKSKESSAGNASEEQPGSRKGRRTFVTRSGLIVPAILVAKSRSSLAGQCLSPSASASINLLHSREDRSRPNCAGLSPGGWKNRSSDDYTFLATAFNSVFSPGFVGEVSIKITGTNKNKLDNDKVTLQGEQLTMQQVMQLEGSSSDPMQFAAHMAAAWCNFSAGSVPPEVLNLDDLQTMWSEINRFGSYSPTQNVTWDVERVKEYLVTTFS